MFISRRKEDLTWGERNIGLFDQAFDYVSNLKAVRELRAGIRRMFSARAVLRCSLNRGMAMSLEGMDGYRVHCEDGCLHLTIEGNYRDLTLRPGMWEAVESGGRTVLSCLSETAHVRVISQPR